MTVYVRQRQFAFGEQGLCSAKLVTGDVSTCMGLIGIHRPSGLVFLAHLDVPWYGGTVKAALCELRERSRATSEVELYDVAGLSPRCLVLVLLALALICSMCGERANFGFVLIGVTAAFLLGTRLRTRILLWRMGFGSPRLLTRRHTSWDRLRRLDFRVNVGVNADEGGDLSPSLFFPSTTSRDRRFEVLSTEDWIPTARRGVRALLRRVVDMRQLTRTHGSA